MGMSAQPVHGQDNDPQVILEALPEEWHDVFLAEYEQAVSAARRPEHFRALSTLLRRWALQAERYADPGYLLARSEAGQGTTSALVDQTHPAFAALVEYERARRHG